MPHKKEHSTQVTFLLFSFDFSALHALAGNNAYEMVKSLLEAGADPNELDSQGNTPLMTLCLLCTGYALSKTPHIFDDLFESDTVE